MTKKDLIGEVSKRLGMPKNRVETIVNSGLFNILLLVSNGKEIYINRLGKFLRVKNSHPKAEKEYRVVFYPSRSLRGRA